MVSRFEMAYENSTPADTAHLLRGIIDKRRTAKLGGFEARGEHDYTGRRRVFNRPEPSRLAIATYDPSELDHMANVIAPEFGFAFNPPAIGHVEFTHDAGATALSGAIYVSEKQVLGEVDFKFSKDDWGKPYMHEAASFVAALGLGAIWNASIAMSFRGASAPSNVVYDSSQLDTLNRSLAVWSGLA